MKTIHKYELDIVDEQGLQVSGGAQVLSVQAQGGKLCLWALVDTSKRPGTLTIAIYGTGHEITEPLGQFLGTVQMPGGLVWHVFQA